MCERAVTTTFVQSSWRTAPFKIFLSNSTALWWYVDTDELQGPLDAEEILTRYLKGQLSDFALVCGTSIDVRPPYMPDLTHFSLLKSLLKSADLGAAVVTLKTPADALLNLTCHYGPCQHPQCKPVAVASDIAKNTECLKSADPHKIIYNRSQVPAIQGSRPTQPSPQQTMDRSARLNRLFPAMLGRGRGHQGFQQGFPAAWKGLVHAPPPQARSPPPPTFVEEQSFQQTRKVPNYNPVHSQNGNRLMYSIDRRAPQPCQFQSVGGKALVPFYENSFPAQLNVSSQFGDTTSHVFRLAASTQQRSYGPNFLNPAIPSPPLQPKLLTRQWQVQSAEPQTLPLPSQLLGGEPPSLPRPSKLLARMIETASPLVNVSEPVSELPVGQSGAATFYDTFSYDTNQRI